MTDTDTALMLPPDIESRVREALAVPDTWTITASELDVILGRAGRNDGPALLWDAWEESAIEIETLRAALPAVWSAAEYPGRCLDPEMWREMFTAAGFTIGGVTRRRFRKPRRLYRGATFEHRDGWAWTGSRKVAEEFATAGYRGRPIGSVWTVLAPPLSILAVIGDQGRGDDGLAENEYVVDTIGLDIRPAEAQQ